MRKTKTTLFYKKGPRSWGAFCPLFERATFIRQMQAFVEWLPLSPPNPSKIFNNFSMSQGSNSGAAGIKPHGAWYNCAQTLPNNIKIFIDVGLLGDLFAGITRRETFNQTSLAWLNWHPRMKTKRMNDPHLSINQTETY